MAYNIYEAELKETIGQPYAAIVHKMHLLLETGQLLMESGADSSRVQRDMLRVANYMGIPESKFHLHITYTTLMLNISDKGQSYTDFRKCTTHGVNMTTISAISKLTWRAARERYSLSAYSAALKEIRSRDRYYTPLVSAWGASFACAGVAKLFGCDWPAFFITALCAALGYAVLSLSLKQEFNAYASRTIAAFVATVLAYVTTLLPLSSTPLYPLMASPLFLVPGLPLINAASDLLNNYFTAGWARIMHTLLIGGALTFGIALAVRCCGLDYFSQIPAVPESDFHELCVAAAIASVGFSMIMNVPPRLLFTTAMGGIIAVCVRNFVAVTLGLGLNIGTFVAASAIGLLASRAIHWVHTPLTVIVVPTVIPLVPGVLLYRLLLAALHVGHLPAPELLTAIQNGVDATLIILAIAVGTAISSIFAQKTLRRANEVRLRRLMPAFARG